jgi:hypothetical protein
MPVAVAIGVGVAVGWLHPTRMKLSSKSKGILPAINSDYT